MIEHAGCGHLRAQHRHGSGRCLIPGCPCLKGPPKPDRAAVLAAAPARVRARSASADGLVLDVARPERQSERVSTVWIADWLPAPLVNGPRGHWSVYQKKLKAAQTMVWAAGQQACLTPVNGRARATITLVFRTHQRRDTDNLYARCKGVIDGLKRGWIIDDDTEHLVLEVRAEVDPKAWGTRIELVPAPVTETAERRLL